MILTPRSSITQAKGLLNMPGQNNCFLNSAVQVLWHLDIFRRSFRELSGHACMAESCIFCALKDLFTQFQYSQESALPPDALRKALAETFSDQRRFQLGYMDDAAECFENILLRIHFHIANQESEDMCNVGHCIPHQKFAMTLVEQNVCHQCRATSEPLPFTQMVHYVSTSALCSQAENTTGTGVSFGTLLQQAGGLGDIRDCPASCGAKIQIRKTLMNRPDIVSIGLVWDSECPTLDHIMKVFQTLGLTLRLKDVFHSVVDAQWATITDHELVGVVTYYGKHYSTFFFHTTLRVWIYFDDATVREVGPRWDQVVEKCRRGHFQPLLLMYSSPHGTPINSTSAPKTVTMVPGHKKTLPGQPCHESKEVLKGGGYFISTRMNTIGHHATFKSGSYPTSNFIDESTYDQVDGCKLNMNHENQVFNYQADYFRNGSWTQGAVQPSSTTPKVTLEIPTYANTQNAEGPIYLNINYNVNKTELPVTDEAVLSKDDANDSYISRKTVENVLNFQKLQRQRSINSLCNISGNRNSSSSLESFENLKKEMASNKVKDLPDGENLPRRRDSGNWSGADNRSNSSIENPYLYVVGNKKSSKAKSLEFGNVNSSDQGYDSFSVSSTDSYPSVTGSPIKLDPRLVQIPEHIQLASAENGSQQPDCDKLCTEADILLTKSHEKEMIGDIVMAALLSDSAAAKARAAMEAPYHSAQSLMTAKMKHNICIMRSSCLHKKLKEAEAEEKRRQKEAASTTNGENRHSRQSSRDSTHGRHSRQGSRDSNIGHSKDHHHFSDGSEKTIELYGTLPKRSGKKRSSHNFAHSEGGSHPAGSNSKSKSKQDKHEKDKSYKELTMEPPKSPSKGQTLKSPENKKKVSKSSKGDKKDSDFSDYASDWEQSRRHSMRKSYSGITRNEDFFSEDLDEDENISDSNILSSSKKQHKVRRKIVMGAFLRRKNRSLPDLREGQGLSDDGARSFDDISMKEKHVEVNLSQLTRGFQQPHHAFVTKDLCNRPLLTRVTPPQVQEAPSLSGKFKGSLAKPPAPAKVGIQPKPPSPSKAATPPKPPPRIDSIQSMTPPECLPPPPPELLYPQEEEDEVFLQNPSAPSSEPAVTSTLLAEIQNKRQQILENSSSSTSRTKETSPDIPEKKNSWLQELQSKQMEMMHKKKSTDDLAVAPGQENNSSTHKNLPAPKDPASKNSLKDISKKQSEEGPCQKAKDGQEKSTSVKALASKFENILTTKSEPASSKHEPETLPFLKSNSECNLEIPERSSQNSQENGDLSRLHISKNYEDLIISSNLVSSSSMPKENYDLKSHLHTSQNVDESRNKVSFMMQDVKESTGVFFVKTTPVVTSSTLTSTGDILNSRFSSQGYSSIIARTPRSRINSLDSILSKRVTPQLNGFEKLPRSSDSSEPDSCYSRNSDQSLSDNTSQVSIDSHSSRDSGFPSEHSTLLNSVIKNYEVHGEPLKPKCSDGKSSLSESVVSTMLDKPSPPPIPPHNSLPSILPPNQTPQCSLPTTPPPLPPHQNGSFQNMPHPLSNQASSTHSHQNHLNNVPQPLHLHQNIPTLPSHQQSLQSSHPLSPPLHSHSPLPHSHQAAKELKRPDKPPDYETALQRLELFRERSSSFSQPASSSCGLTSTMAPLNSSTSGSNLKKKKGPKKNVTFSDKVILVACADDEVEEHLPNPLLEKVYQQHLHQKEPSIEEKANCTSEFAKVNGEVLSSEHLNNNTSVNSLCNLCHQKTISPPNLYCTDCTVYLARFRPR